MATEIKKYLDTTALGTLVEQIKAKDADVLAAAKKYTDDAGKLYDAAGSASTAEANAKTYTDTLANGQVKTNKEDIAKLNGDASTEGSVAKAIADAKAIIDAEVDVVEGKADKNAQDIAAINDGTNGILAQAKGYTDDEVAKVQAEVDTLETYVGTIPTTATATDIIGYIQEKTSGIATDTALEELAGRVAQAETALEGKITDVETAVATEKSRAEGVEAGIDARLQVVEGDYLKSTDKTELQEGIDAVASAVELLTNGVDTEKIDGVNDLIKYVEEHGTEVTGMQQDIAGNTSAIEGVAGRMTTAEGKITALETASTTYATTVYVDETVEVLVGEDTAIKGRLDVLEAAVGESGSVADDIAEAKQEAIDTAAADAKAKADKALEDAKAYADAEDAKIETRVDALEAASATHALASDVTTLAGRVTKNETDIGTLQTDLGVAEDRIGVNEGAISTINTELAKKALKTDLEDAVARIGVNEGAISTLNETVATKADADDLDSAVERIGVNEAAIAANTSAINSFTPITSDEVLALFA